MPQPRLYHFPRLYRSLLLEQLSSKKASRASNCLGILDTLGISDSSLWFPWLRHLPLPLTLWPLPDRLPSVTDLVCTAFCADLRKRTAWGLWQNKTTTPRSHSGKTPKPQVTMLSPCRQQKPLGYIILTKHQAVFKTLFCTIGYPSLPTGTDCDL